MRRLVMLWRVVTALADVLRNPRTYRRRAGLVLACALPALLSAACAATTKPLAVACTSCALLQASDLCAAPSTADKPMMGSSKVTAADKSKAAAPKAAPRPECPEGQRYEIVNYKQWLDGTEAPRVECRKFN